MACSANINEINNALSSEIFNTLQNDSKESIETLHAINNFIDNSNGILIGNMWNIERQKLQKYNELLSQRTDIEEQLYDALREALILIRDYLGDDEELDLTKLEELKDTVKNIELEISNLQAMMKETKTINLYDKDGNITKSYEASVYNHAELQQKINEAQVLLEETRRLIKKIEGLQDVMNRAQNIINHVYGKIQKYENDINNIDNNGNIFATGAVGLINFVGGIGKAVENVSDGILWTGGGLIFTIGDWFGADTTESRQELAQMIGTDVVGGAISSFFEETEAGISLNANSYYSYDTNEMQGIYSCGNGAITFVAEAFLPTPVAVAVGSFHNIGAQAEELYASDADALGGLGGDYSWRITASGIEGGINGYLSNNAINEIKKLSVYGFGHLNEATGLVRQYNGMGDFVHANIRDIIGETTMDAFSNMAGDFADKGNLTAMDVLVDTGQALTEQGISLIPGSTNFAQISSPLLDIAQGTGIDDNIVDAMHFNNNNNNNNNNGG